MITVTQKSWEGGREPQKEVFEYIALQVGGLFGMLGGDGFR